MRAFNPYRFLQLILLTPSLSLLCSVRSMPFSTVWRPVSPALLYHFFSLTSFLTLSFTSFFLLPQFARCPSLPYEARSRRPSHSLSHCYLTIVFSFSYTLSYTFSFYLFRSLDALLYRLEAGLAARCEVAVSPYPYSPVSGMYTSR
jgi:hypothetical protein